MRASESIDAGHVNASSTMAPAHRRALGVFLRHLAQGERVAQRAATRQATLAPTARLSRFLRSQARQEQSHALIFDGFACALGAAPLDLRHCPYRAYADRLDAAVDRGDFLDSVIGTQVVLEALGELLLARLDRGIGRHGNHLRRLRRRILAQEATHHAFGTAILAAARAAGHATDDVTRISVGHYATLAARLIEAGAPALEHFGVSEGELRAELERSLASWTAPC